MGRKYPRQRPVPLLRLGLFLAIGCSTFTGRRPDLPPEAVVQARDVSACDAPDLVWKTGNKTYYESYPEPGSEECIVYSGCQYEGMFAACPEKKPESWVQAHNIAAFFPGFESMKQHDLCIRAGNRTMVVTVYDTCGDADCDGCCTQNRGNADALIDLEKYTNARFGLPDGRIQWADLGPTASAGCE